MPAQKSQKQSNEQVARLGLTPRQQELNALWARYRCVHYDARKIDWDGRERLDALSHEVVATQGSVPPGFQDSAPALPLKFRRPTAPYNLEKVIVDRFTSLLFSEKRHPKFVVPGDDLTEDYLNTLMEVGRLWQRCIQLRTFGGAEGTGIIGFQFLDGRPLIEVIDPRWAFPDFADRQTHRLRSLEVRYYYQGEVINPVTQKREPTMLWYRRLIDENADIVFKPVEVTEDEPQWVPDTTVTHGFGFCPWVWVQNMPVLDDIDGDPDCSGIHDIVDAMDQLLAQAHRGILFNCDPTLILTTKAELKEIKKGSDNSIKIPDGDAKYLEMLGSGPKAALELFDKLRQLALEVAQCVLDNPDQVQKTATEVERSFGSMTAKADMMSEQYGERGIKVLAEMMLKAARLLQTPVIDPATNTVTRKAIVLPPKVETDGAGNVLITPRVLGENPDVTVQMRWPGYYDHGPDKATAATQAAVGAFTGQLISHETAVRYAAKYFDVEDPRAELALITAEAAVSQQLLEQQMMNSMHPPGAPPTPAGQ
jgi:hypothetical protein